MKTSIVLATYNGEKNILEQLDSLKNQTVAVDEVLIQDDISTDDTYQMISAYIKKYELNNWHLTKNKKNLGWRKNFLELLSRANGDVVFTCDQDDIWNLQKIELMSETFKDNPNVNVLVSSYTELVEDGGLSEDIKEIASEPTESSTIKKVLFDANNIFLKRPGCVYAVRGTFIPKVMEYASYNPVHDMAMWGSGIITDSLYLTTLPLIQWRKHGASSFKKEIDASKIMEQYGARLNLLKRRLERVLAGKMFLKANPTVIAYDAKHKIYSMTAEELEMRIKLLEKKSNLKIAASFFKYKNRFYFFSDSLHVLRLKKSLFRRN